MNYEELFNIGLYKGSQNWGWYSDEKRAEEINEKLTFTNKDEYLDWRAAWKSRMKLLVQQIREAKRQRSEDRYYLSKNAWFLLQVRKAGKVLAARQYEESKKRAA